jgi:hypothetical protein
VTPREVTVEAASRWDAVELLRRLQSLRTARTYMIQGAPDRWIVYAQPTVRNADGSEVPGILDDLLASVERWLVDRGLETCELRLDGEPEHIARPV